jgi:hypothetical protein
MNLLIALRSEILKTKRTSAFYLTLIAAAFGPFASMLDLAFDGVSPEDGKVILNQMFTTRFQMTNFVVLPMFLMLSCTLLHQVEFRNNAWKQVLASPQSRGNIFLAKFINVQLLVLVFLVTNQLLMFVSAVIFHFMQPSLHVLNQPINGSQVMITLANSYVTLLALCAIQFWLGLRFRNFIAPIGIGLACWFLGTILVMQSQLGIASLFPYSFHVYGNFPQYKPQFSSVGWTSLVYTALFLVLGFLDFRRRRMSA